MRKIIVGTAFGLPKFDMLFLSIQIGMLNKHLDKVFEVHGGGLSRKYEYEKYPLVNATHKLDTGKIT